MPNQKKNFVDRQILWAKQKGECVEYCVLCNNEQKIHLIIGKFVRHDEKTITVKEGSKEVVYNLYGIPEPEEKFSGI